MSDEQKRIFLAVAMSLVISSLWQYFFAPDMSRETVRPQEVVEVKEVREVKNDTIAPASMAAEQRFITLQDAGGHHSLVLGNRASVNWFSNADVKFSFSEMLGIDEKSLKSGITSPVEVQVVENGIASPIYFDNYGSVSAKNDQFIGTNNKYGVEFKVVLAADSSGFQYVLKSKEARNYRIVLKSQAGEISGRNPREFLLLTKGVERFAVGKEEKGEGNLKWLAIEYYFHLFAMTLDTPTSVSYASTKDGNLFVSFNSSLQELRGNIVYVKKYYDHLAALGNNLQLSVDFGILGLLAVPILRCLQFFYKFAPNYGVAIILLTILLRIVTFPLQHKSYKSMKKMQDLKPDMDKIKEKFKDDPQRMQKETMELFKRAGTNPLSGCLPILIQMPIFFAFYKVLYSAVELMEAPFVFWVKDLSAKDPYYVLPLLMTAAMYIQQKMTPTATMDPTQQKVMMFMPLVFGFIMKDLPSGLALYIFVSTVLGIAQQLLVYKSKSA